MTRLVLASASPARLGTLRAAGLDPHVEVSEVDEDAVLHALALARGVEEIPLGEPDDPDDTQSALVLAADAVPAADQVLALARAKARDVVARCGRALREGGEEVLVLGCDSMLEMMRSADGRRVVVGKPGTAERARERWRDQRGTEAQLFTGHWLMLLAPQGAGGAPDVREAGATSTATIRFAEVSDAEIDAYVATGEPLRVAGAFTIDGLGGQFVRGIDGDHHGVVGVSMPLLRELAARLGVRLTDLWR